MNFDKQLLISLIKEKLQADVTIAAQAVETARDTATHKDCLGSSKYETMGTEASYLAKGQGERLLELERALAYFKQSNPQQASIAEMLSLITLEDDLGKQRLLFLAADAGGLAVEYQNKTITILTPKSPLGRKLMGKTEGETFELNNAGTLKSYEVRNIQ